MFLGLGSKSAAEVSFLVVEEGIHRWQFDLRIRIRLTGQNQLGLVKVVAIEVAIAERADQSTGPETELLRHHVGQ